MFDFMTIQSINGNGTILDDARAGMRITVEGADHERLAGLIEDLLNAYRVQPMERSELGVSVGG